MPMAVQLNQGIQTEKVKSLQMHAFPKEIRKIVFNEDYDEDGVYEEKQGKQNNYVAVWFRQERRDGTFRTVLLPKVMFTNPKIDGETAEKIGILK